MLTWKVPKEESGIKLIAFLKGKLEFSMREIKRGVENQLCQINGRTERFASSILGYGDTITFHEELLNRLASRKTAFEPDRILFEDADLIIYNKPSGIACDPAGLEKVIRQAFPHALLTHRLDRDTTGALILAKNTATYEAMIALFRKRTIHKEYLALVEGLPKGQEGIIKSYLGKVKAWHGQSLWGEVKGGLYAETAWRCEKKGKKTSLIRCFPKTGRTHQIRVHLSSIGLPLVGDGLYNPQCGIPAARCLLHAAALRFIHPGKGKSIYVEAPLPDDFIGLL